MSDAIRDGPTESFARVGSAACACILAATVLSGPGAMLLVELTHPQPPWRDARTLAEHFHFVQSIPYFLGFFLIGGFAVLLSALHAAASVTRKARTGAALVFCAMAGGLVFENYVLQTTFVPHLARTYDPRNDALIAASSMVNPSSFAWGLEMWGYGLLGIATWLAAPAFSGSPLERRTARGFVANGFLSVAGALATAAVPGWVMTVPGLVAFALWNVLVIVVVASAFVAFRRRLSGRIVGERGA